MGAVACHLLALYGLQVALHQPARLIPETTVEVTLVAPSAGPVVSAPPEASVIEPAPPAISPAPVPIPPPEPTPVTEPDLPEPTPEEPKPKPVAVQPVPAARPANARETTAPAVATAGAVASAEPSTTTVSNRAAASASSLPGQPAHPRYRRNPTPDYPAPARQRGQEGLVLLGVRVTAEGRAAEVTVKQSSGHPMLDAAAVKAVRRWEFEPARLGAIALESNIEVPVRFQLAN
jgi:periplasmic protein TonB